MGRAATSSAALSLAVACTLGGCSPLPAPRPTALPTYRYAGIELSGSTRGILERSGECVLLKLGDSGIVPIWPQGTKVTDAGVVVPPANGGALLRFGEVGYLYGGHVGAMDESLLRTLPSARSAAGCGTSGFLVNRAESQRQLDASLPRPPSTGGKLERRSKCLLVSGPDGTTLPIWPEGTQIGETTVATPNLRGRKPLEIGGFVGIEGRYVHADDGSLQATAGPAAARCAKRGMIVEKARRLFAPNDAQDLAREADAVLLVRIEAINFADPQPDGFLSTIQATVVETLKGPYRSGQTILVRHPLGQDASGQWQLTAHSMHFPTHKPGDQLLLFVNGDFYAGQVEARGGRPLPRHVGAGGGLFRVIDGKIVNDGDIQMPGTLSEMRAQIGGTSIKD